MAKDPLYYSLLEACEQPGCPVCRVTLHLVDRYLNALFYESVNDIPTRTSLRNSRGFCSSHAWRLLDGEVGNALGIAIIYHDVLTNVLRELPGQEIQKGRGGNIATFLTRAGRQAGELVRKAVQALTPGEECLACRERREANRLVSEVLLASLADDRLLAALAASDGLCLPHLRQSLERAQGEQQLAGLLQASRPQLEALNAQLGEFIRKNDYRFREEGFGEEGSSWRRAISKAQGERES
jgi:hypothetical protein